MVDIVSLVTDYWNNAITILTFLIIAATAYYQIRHYRSQRPSIDIQSIEQPKYYSASRDPLGDWMPIKPEADDDISRTIYELVVVVDNTGSEQFTISNTELQLSSENISLYKPSTGPRGISYTSVDGHDRVKLTLKGISDRRKTYPSEIRGTLVIDSTAGVAEEPITLTRSA